MDGDNKIIKNVQVLEDVFIPSRIAHREGQLKAMRDCMKPLTQGQNPRDSFLWGKPGTGKTCIARYLTQELGRETGVKIVYINCWEAVSRFKVLFSMVKSLGLSLSVHRKGTPLDELLDDVRKYLENSRMVVILDEADRLEDERIMYDLANSPNLCLMIIANQETALHDLDARTRSRLASAENIEFHAYSGQEVLDILRDRREWGLVPGVLKDSQMEKIAFRANGDARFAIGMLRAAAQGAESQDLKNIPDSLLGEALSKAGLQDPWAKRLNAQQEMVLDILKKERSMGAALLYQEFLKSLDRRGMNPVGRRMFRKHLDLLLEKGMIKPSGVGRWRVYTVV